MHNKIFKTEKPANRVIGKSIDFFDNIRILVVDDEFSIRKALSWVFENMGFDATVASSGFEALDKFLIKPFDIVLTDLNMKGIDGFSLVKKIKDRSPDTPIILLTGEHPYSVKKRAKNSMVDFILFKPFQVEEVENTVLRLLEIEKGEVKTKIAFQ